MGFDTWQLVEVRDTVARAAHAAGCDRDRVADLVLAVNEVATNAVEHGSGDAHVALWTGPGSRELLCEVHDGGRLLDLLPGRGPAPVGLLAAGCGSPASCATCCTCGATTPAPTSASGPSREHAHDVRIESVRGSQCMSPGCTYRSGECDENASGQCRAGGEAPSRTRRSTPRPPCRGPRCAPGSPPPHHLPPITAAPPRSRGHPCLSINDDPVSGLHRVTVLGSFSVTAHGDPVPLEAEASTGRRVPCRTPPPAAPHGPGRGPLAGRTRCCRRRAARRVLADDAGDVRRGRRGRRGRRRTVRSRSTWPSRSTSTRR